ncbi:MAG: response regulator, partial [Acidobacteria bacterium]|nr:response regulator [Acidobacteriota bacterium]
MPRISICCTSCRTTAEIELSSSEDQRLQSQGFLTRFCNRCRGQSRWERQAAAASSFRSDLISAEPEPVKELSILVIDDDESILAVLEKALVAHGYDVKLANSARRAVELLGRGDYDLILSDVRMPEFDGKQLYTFLDQTMQEYRSRIVFLTGDTGNPETMKF